MSTSMVKVFVQVTIVKMGEINTLKECFDADVLIKSRWRQPVEETLDPSNGGSPVGTWNPNLYIENAIGDPPYRAFLETDLDEATGITYIVESKRIRGSFSETMELWDFPFDVQALSLLIKADQPIELCDLMEDPANQHKVHTKTFIDEQEFILYKHALSTYPHLNKDPELPKAHRPSIKVSSFIARRPAYFVWSLFMILFLLSAVSLSTFALDIVRLVQSRLMLLSSVVAAVIMFKGAINTHIPKVSYLNFVDRYMLTSFCFVAFEMFWDSATSLIAEVDRITFDWYATYGFIVVFVLYNIIFLLWIRLGPYAIRLNARKDEESFLARSAALRSQREKRGKNNNNATTTTTTTPPPASSANNNNYNNYYYTVDDSAAIYYNDIDDIYDENFV